jgi:HAE1 family hydrophobic/amphiphilic exporter-1
MSVFGGLLMATFINYLVTPILYVVVKNLTDTLFGGKRPGPPPDDSELVEATPPEQPLEPSELSQPASQRFQEGDSPA